MTDSHDHHEGDHHGSPFIQHHYDDAQHQFDSGKLGIWFFLVQEVLFFSGLFVAYILFRNHRPEIFSYAHKYLDVRLGALNTCVLIISSLTAAWSVRCAQLGQRKALIFCLATTIICAFGFLGVKFIEYRHKYIEGELWGEKFDPCHTSGGAELLTKEDHCEGTKRSECRPGNIDQDPNAEGWQVDCSVDEVTGTTTGGTFTEKARRTLPTCIMESEEGGPPEAKNAPCWEIAENPWVCNSPEKKVAALVHYNDEEVRWSDEVHIELTCKDAPPPKLDMDAKLPGEAGAGVASVNADHHEKTEREEEEEAWMKPPPPHTNMFFSIYFAMTGLHGIHVIGGIVLFIWLLFRAIRGDFSADYFGPIDYAALYWHLVDLIWIFLFPLLYLIH